MKKILFSVVCLVMVGMQSVQAQVAIAALHHNDSVKIYSAAKIQTAIDAAMAGDTIYLSEGIFGGFTVTKPIVIIGAGQTTSISSNVSIGKSGQTLEDGLLLSGLNIIQDIYLYGYVSGVKISQCNIAGTCYFNSNSAGSFDNIEIIMSQIKKLSLNSTYVKGLTVVASKISTVSGQGAAEGSVTFLNCNISSVDPTSNVNYNNYMNCIIGTTNHGVFQNCLYCKLASYPVLYNCYQNSDFTLDDDLNCSLTDEQLKEGGYLGSDGSVVGITGGDVPFTLVMPIVQVTEHSLEVNQAERKLKISLKLGNK